MWSHLSQTAQRCSRVGARLSLSTDAHFLACVRSSRKPSNGADKLQFPCSQPRALVQHGISQDQSFWLARVPNLARFWHAPPSQAGDHWKPITVDGKTTIEALQFLTTFGTTPPQVPDLRKVRRMDPWMSQSSFTNFDRTGTTFKTDIQGLFGHLSGNTSNQLTPDILQTDVVR